MLELKGYQQRALGALRLYLAECVRSGNADTAFYTVTLETRGQRVVYKEVRELPGLPYACLRIPTGGGKTLVACHAVSLAARELVHADTPVVLWLVPSNTIREQTLKALRDRRHAYRQALDAGAEAVNVLDVEEALYVTPAIMNAGTTIVVSTIQAFRVEDTIGRRVYADSGNLMSHFDRVSVQEVAGLERGTGGQLIHSLANVLKTRRPIVIVDEAHNARTPLSFEVLARFSPSCIVEFTATPDRERNPSNVLYTASAAELNAEAMIKMPIRLEARREWRELLSDAVSCLAGLEREARLEEQATGEYLRPIMLLQAQPRHRGQETVTAGLLRACLIQDNGVPEDQIAIETGEVRQLEGKDVLSRDCPVRYVITVQALREGWDCPFAYVLCSVAESRSTRAVEQILGRIMRLPRAQRKERESLNAAYAFAASDSFREAAECLKDGLIENGFERQEAADFIVPARQLTYLETDQPFVGTLTVQIPEPLDSGGLPPELQAKVTFDAERRSLVFRGAMTDQERDQLSAALATQEGRAAIEEAYRLSKRLVARLRPPTAAERGLPFEVPVLAVRQGDVFEQLEETHLLDHPWSLRDCDASLSEAEYPQATRAGEQGEVYVTERGELRTRFIANLHQQMTWLAGDTHWSVADLVIFLDRTVPHTDIPSDDCALFLTRVVRTLMDQRAFSLAELIREKYRLREAVSALIDKHRADARKRAYQALLAPDCLTPLAVTAECVFRYDPRGYPFGARYEGSYDWCKHYYRNVGEFDSQEELACAQWIDQLDPVEFWVRNIPHREPGSFWLQTSTDRFYPDFVCKLKEGRYLVVEYKGAHLLDTPDTREKRDLGELWERRSTGLCLFVMVTAPDYDPIARKVHSSL